MSRKFTRTTVTIVVEELELPSSLFPAANIVDVDGEEVEEESQYRPLRKCRAFSTALAVSGRQR